METLISRMKAFTSCLLAVSCVMQHVNGTVIRRAQCFMRGASPVTGHLELEEFFDGTVHITGQITGLTPGKHGFHAHTYGDVFTNGCESTGPHYNPLHVRHGDQHNTILTRHVGDLGNVEADANGVADVDIKDKIISLTGPFSIVGRAFVVHSNEDDLGVFVNDPGSTATGNSGSRLACGIVFISPEDKFIL